MVDKMVLASPTQASYGISFIRSFICIFTEPPVAWKKDPWGMESMTVAPL